VIGILLLGLKLFVLKGQPFHSSSLFVTGPNCFLHSFGASTDFNCVIFVVSAMGLYVFAEIWILSFVQEIAGVSTDPQGSWSTMHILFLSFLVCKAKAGPPDPQGICPLSRFSS